ncbi:unnamed protein product [Didymodactylos carnosus]|uniref:Uncharacterized protein n=1 Tax=Didymodactylos carnosus TaxID=1234261 RepID=A0A814SVN1_9BILA|nr:unnamed protein product [Didymodactylos carnosus]CAF1151023.1 unnamed protein product [Didymodactylos carnosus]CAF3715566.1 unnamed protein product [Didymodactylos carnosus]CAF3914572.1 unnamed protein product [Didymodactylos carnosus]
MICLKIPDIHTIHEQTTTQLTSTSGIRDSGYESCDAEKLKISNSQSNVSLSPDGQTLIVSYYTTPSVVDKNNNPSQQTAMRTFSSSHSQQHPNDLITHRVRLAEQEIIEV